MDEASAYRRAGVDLAAADEALARIRRAVASTHDERVLSRLGAFGGLFALDDLPDRPVLVASTDGVGTKTKVATAYGQVAGLGGDLVNHCVNDILVQGARPLFFLDYLASSRLVPERIEEIVDGIARACRSAGIPLLGGETAEMPGVYLEEELDLVGTIVGVVGRNEIVDGSAVRRGDQILALASSGPHTNGFSLIRSLLHGRYDEPLGDRTVAQALLEPHRSYLKSVTPLLAEQGLIRGMAHVTGGGIPGNLPRALPAGLGARVDLQSWPVPEVFRLIAIAGDLNRDELYQVFNMGVGFLLIVPADRLEEAMRLCPEPAWHIGEVVEAEGIELQ